MLILEPKDGQKIVLKDEKSGAKVVIKTFRRDNGNIALAFDAPKFVRIMRVRQ